MNYSALKYKIILIFMTPAVALIYFSVSLIYTKYEALEKSALYIRAATMANQLSELIHHLQIERGLGSGYLAAPDREKYRRELVRQQKLTDDAYRSFLKLLHRNGIQPPPDPDTPDNGPYFDAAVTALEQLDYVRKEIVGNKIGFEEEIRYFSKINRQLLNALKTCLIILQPQTGDGLALFRLQRLKENAGLERAYVYHSLLSPSHHDRHLPEIRTLILRQASLMEEFRLEASPSSLEIYDNTVRPALIKTVNTYRQRFFAGDLRKTDAPVWFSINSAYINTLEKVTKSILRSYVAHAANVRSEARDSLILTALFWLASLTAFVFLIYLLKQLIDKEKQLADDLRIAAHTFDSHEAMSITDAKGTILKVNKAFTEITGYEAEEVIGKNPRMFKSMKHDAAFYREMWEALNTKGKWSAEIYNKRKNGEIYPERLSITAIRNDEGVTTHYIAQFFDISDLKNAQQEAEHQANHDFLTGLLNRKALMQRLHEEYAKAVRHRFMHAFLFIDIDGFKPVNDDYGHHIGDKLLLEVAERLNGLLREEDLLARISGDEFVVLILNLDKDKSEAAMDVQKVYEKILHCLNRPFEIEGYRIRIGASIGIKLFPDSEENIHDVVMHADIAMYQAKRGGKNRAVFFDKEIEKRMKERQRFEREITRAMDEGEFRFFYQPKIRTGSGEIAGAEMLIRWLHPEQGLLYPDSFLNIAAESGLLSLITRHAVGQACRFLRRKQDFKGVLSINITTHELQDPNFTDEIRVLTGKYGITPSQIEFEILENDLIKDFESVINTINTLKDFGIRFAIDDFGTGYSSMTYLQKLPVDTLKIDRHFMLTLEKASHRELVRMMIHMAKAFDMKTVVEGVETPGQLAFITEAGADFYQGFLFSEALEEERFSALLDAGKA